MSDEDTIRQQAGAEVDHEAFMAALAAAALDDLALGALGIHVFRKVWDAGRAHGLELRGCCKIEPHIAIPPPGPEETS